MQLCHINAKLCQRHVPAESVRGKLPSIQSKVQVCNFISMAMLTPIRKGSHSVRKLHSTSVRRGPLVMGFAGRVVQANLEMFMDEYGFMNSTKTHNKTGFFHPVHRVLTI